MRKLKPETLTAEAFAPFGTVMDTTAAELRLINGGTTERFHALALADTETGNGRTILSLFRGQPREFPYAVDMMERHPLGSQAFFPVTKADWIAVVAPDVDGRPGEPRAFLVPGHIGVQYARNVWHHPLIAVGRVSDFLVMDREGDGINLEEADYDEPYLIAQPAN
jgi:ureidoglycolate lyase